MDIDKESLNLHKKLKGKIEICSKSSIENLSDLSIVYTPGVAEVSKKISENPKAVYDYTFKGNSVAVITDGSAVLGLGNIGAEASIPVMEGKCVLFKEFAGLDAFPIAIKTQDTEEFIQTVKNIYSVFGGINLEDISAPKCFEIEERLTKELDIPVFHDDQHGTAIVVLAGLINAMKLTGKNKKDIKVLVNGAGAAATAITKLLLIYGIKNIVVLDSQGAICKEREGLNSVKKEISCVTNLLNEKGSLKEIIKDKDVFIGVSKGDLLKKEDISNMAENPVIFALANPVPEISPEEARKGGAKIIATGRSDYDNQVNNVLAFPGIFKGALKARVRNITEDMKLAAAKAIADSVPVSELEKGKIIPGVFEGIADIVAERVEYCAKNGCPFKGN
ncbi:MAG: NAD(P)-dependent malic enzyme [Minisyncoccales bacterium]